MVPKTCSIPECGNKQHAKSLCKRHYQQQWRTGSAEIIRPNAHGTPEERFWEKVPNRAEGECWDWAGGLDKDGYGNLRYGNTQVRAHRFSYELHNGQPPAGVVRHACNNPKCVNPAHLSDGTHQENMDDRRAAGNYTYDTCRRGHPWTPETIMWQDKARTKKTCRTCRYMPANEKRALGRAA